jgi:hypothetical protein
VLVAELVPELAALLLLVLLLLELLPHALAPSARTPTAANVPDHALTFIRSSASAALATGGWPERSAPGPEVGRCLTFDKISTTLERRAQGSRPA